MKHIVALFITCVLIFTLSACSGVPSGTEYAGVTLADVVTQIGDAVQFGPGRPSR